MTERWKPFTLEELKSLQQALNTAETQSMLDIFGVQLRLEILEAISWQEEV